MQSFQSSTQDIVGLYKGKQWDKKTFANYLAQTHYFTTHSVKMLVDSLPGLYNDKKVFNRFMDHIKEETGHEILAKRDVEKLGFKMEDFKELIETKAMWQTQFYHISQNNYAVLGYILCLELCAIELCSFLNEQAIKFGAESKFMKVHAEEDIGHVEEAMKLIDSLSIQDKAYVIQVYNESCEHLKRMLAAV